MERHSQKTLHFDDGSATLRTSVLKKYTLSNDTSPPNVKSRKESNTTESVLPFASTTMEVKNSQITPLLISEDFRKSQKL